MSRIPRWTLVLALFALPTMALAQKKAPTVPTHVVGAAMSRNLDGSYDLRVNVRSQDKGPEYYADRVEVLDPSGKLLHTIKVDESHENKQPFGVSAANLRLPDGIEHIVLRARMKPGGAHGRDRMLKLPPSRKK